MTDTRPHLIPDEGHPITIEPAGKTVTVSRGSVQIARSERALALQESTYPVAYYIPLEDVDQGVLAASDLHTYCPYKGEASYYDVTDGSGDDELAGSVWYYGEPYPAVGEIAGHVAFYADRFAITAE